jgi:hypothetical protein
MKNVYLRYFDEPAGCICTIDYSDTVRWYNEESVKKPWEVQYYHPYVEDWID